MAEVRPSHIQPGVVPPNSPIDDTTSQDPQALIAKLNQLMAALPAMRPANEGDPLNKLFIQLSLRVSTLASTLEKQDLDKKKAEKFFSLGRQAAESYSKHLEALSDTPKDLRAILAGLRSYRELQDMWRKDTKLLPGKIEVSESLKTYSLESLCFPEEFSRIVHQVVERSCAELGGFYFLVDSTMFFCVDSLDRALFSQQDAAIRDRLMNLRKSFIKYAYALFMFKQLQSIQTERVCLTDSIYVFPLEEVVLQKNELRSYLPAEFEQLFSLFEFLCKDKGYLDSAWQTKRFPFPQAISPKVQCLFLKMEREGIGFQKKLLRSVNMFLPEETFDELMRCCDDTMKWLPIATRLAATRMGVLRQYLQVGKKPKVTEQEQLRTYANCSHIDSLVPGIKSFYKSCVSMCLQTSAFPFLVRWFTSRATQAIEGLASAELPDEFHLWFSEVNIVRLETLLEYAQSFFRGKASTSDMGRQSTQIVRNICQGIQIGKSKTKELQNIFCDFLNSLGQLKNTILDSCSELFKCKSLESFLQENATPDNMRNPNFLIIDWLAAQVSGNDVLLRHLDSFLLVHQAFTDSLRRFLLSKSLPKPLAKKVLEALYSRCSTSFFSNDHEAIIALKLYSQQNGLLMASPRGVKKISLGFDEALICMLKALQHTLFPEADTALDPPQDPETQHQQELATDFSSSSPSSTSTDCSEIDDTTDAHPVDTLVKEVANMTLCPTPEVEDKGVSSCSTEAPKQRKGQKKRKKQSIQKQKLIAPPPERNPSLVDEERGTVLPLYWRQYCNPNKLIKLAVRAGFDLDRINGSHHFYRKQVENEPPTVIIISYHASEEIKPGPTRDILRQILKFHVIE